MNGESTRVSPARLKAMLRDAREIALLDVREAGQFGASHLFFAVPLPYSRLELDVGMLVPRLSTRIVLCDDGGDEVAPRAARRLRGMGYTDVALLDGGIKGWAAAGYSLFAGVNVPSKTLGELVEQSCHTPHITPLQLERMRKERKSVVVLDGRPYAEYRKMNIPGAICCPNAELPYRISSIVRDPDTTIVVNCAGRTRSLIGAQTLIDFGVANPVYALENGTQGWVLSDMELERAAERKYPGDIDPAGIATAQAAASRLMARYEIAAVQAEAVRRWLEDRERTTYVCDVRTPEEYAAGSIAGAVHAPGGQLIQATDQWIGVRHARVVLVDGGELVRASMVAMWLKRLGCEPFVLRDGIRADLCAPAPASAILPTLRRSSAAQLEHRLRDGTAFALDVGASMRFRKAHIPGSRWSIRPRIVEDARRGDATIVLVADDERIARLASVDLAEGGIRGMELLEGGLAAWTAAGKATEAAPAVPPDAECIDHLFFVHDRHAGNREAMRQYLAWETGLLAQLDEDERASFRV